MHEGTHTGVFTTISAVAGGIGKLLFTQPLLLDISFDGLMSVSVYAGASAVVGYFVKLGLDWSTRAFFKRLNEREVGDE